MINFHENLYTTQWLDLVFQNRNKSYGAYELRKHNSETTSRAFFYACLLFSSLIVMPWIYGQISSVVPAIDLPKLADPVEVNLTAIRQSKPIPPPAAQTQVAQPKLKTIQYTKMVVAPSEQLTNIEPPTQVQVAQSLISNSNSEGADATAVNLPERSTSGSEGMSSTTGPAENTIYSIDGVEKYPEFPGGQEAFSKFLSRHLRYPGIASEKGIQGRVIVSFIIERNGDLSHIKILSGIGSGCDEEAMRVLAKSPQWKPGIQNKQNVRVAYTLPISFRLPD